jgi:hypothetical protein
MMTRFACASISLVVSLAASAASAVVLEVNAAAACPGAGTPAAPFCTIGLAAAVAAPGDTVRAAPGDYREQVTVPASGSPGSPILYRAAGPGVRVLGTEDLSDPALWAPAGGTRFSTPFSPDTNTRQVFVDGVRLTEAADLASLAPNGFFFDSAADVLTVDLGGANPGTRDVEAGARSFGFDVNGRSHVVVDGFLVSGHNTSGIRVRASANVAIRNNVASNARSFGILGEGTTAPVVQTTALELSGNEAFGNGDGGLRLRAGVSGASVLGNVSHHNLQHGLSVTETTDSRIAGNELFRNARPGGVSTTGMILDPGSHRIQVERNLAYENQDSGFQVSGGTLGGVLVRNQDNVVVRNLSFGNGDHGFDNRESDRTLLVSNTAYGNTNDGFSVEGNAANITLANNIGANNGGNDLFVATSSTGGFSADYDVWWNSGAIASPEIEFAGVAYQSVADFRAATGQEVHGSSADPLLANPAGGDFHPRAPGSAIDSANAAAPGFQALDFDGLAPVDLPGVPNTGAGVPNFADRGALEARDAAPTARLRVFPRRTFPGGVVLADASDSRDDVRIVSYRFDWGDGTVETHAIPFAAHRYDAVGVFHVRLTVTDTAGQTATAQQPVQVRSLRLKATKATKATKEPKPPKK